jgi:predicted ester cyclase
MDDVAAYGLTDEEGKNISGINEFRRFFRNFRVAFPDIKVTVEETISDGDKIGAVCRVSGLHTGDGLKLRATNQPVDFSGILMVRLREGKIAEAWNYFDFMTMFAQLGALSLNLQ